MGLEEKRVCVYMQVYRNEESMYTAIDSVLNQTYQNFRFCILVGPATKQAVLAYAGKDPRVEVYDGKIGECNLDYYSRWKKLLQKGGESYFTSIDADDWYDKHYIEELVAFASTHHTDITACGNFFVTAEGEKSGVRRLDRFIWNTCDTAKVLPYVYGFLRTIWGKLIRSDLILNQRMEEIPDKSAYGGYGGDTLYMFNLLQTSKRIGICDQALYYYRVSASGSSYGLRDGRLDSDAFLYHYVTGILSKFGEIGEIQERFLYQVYGNAMKDTTVLLLHQNFDEGTKTDKLLYIYQNPLTAKLLQREHSGHLTLPGQNTTIFTGELRKLVFHNMKVKGLTELALQNYLNLFEILYSQWAGMLSIAEFAVLLAKPEQLDAFAEGKYEELFAMLTIYLKKAKPVETASCLLLLRRISKTIILKPVLNERKFVLKYRDLLNEINQNRDEEAFYSLKQLFSAEKIPYQAETLIELWTNLAARGGNADQFVQGNLCRIEVLCRQGKMGEARECYEELCELGVAGEMMDQLRNILEQ